MMRVLSATEAETAEERYARMSAWVSCACAEVATLPVPMAQTGSYAITILLRWNSHSYPSYMQAKA